MSYSYYINIMILIFTFFKNIVFVDTFCNGFELKLGYNLIKCEHIKHIVNKVQTNSFYN